jgi:hypothetical protein
MSPALYFAELEYDRTATWISTLVGNVLRLFGWISLPLFCRPYNKKTWYDRNHPKYEAAVDLVSHLVLETGLQRGAWALIIGDSTSSFFLRMENETFTRNTFANEVRKITGVNIMFSAISGTHFSSPWDRSFLGQAKKATDRYPINSYNAVILIGGWNEESNWTFSPEYIREKVEELTLFCRPT